METKNHQLFNYDGHFETFTGKRFSLFNPTVEQIDINDIARGLAFKGHFSGQTPKYFSIASHCILVKDLLPPDAPKQLKLAALLHDGSEAYIGDMIKPLKIHLPVFQQIEDSITQAIFTKYHLDISLLAEVKKYDKTAQMMVENVLYPYVSSITALHQIYYKNKAVCEALLAILAVLRYEIANKTFPESLEILVSERYLNCLPIDPFSDQPLIYKKENGNFLLYSIGRDFDDDDGLHNNNWGKTDGDYVFWPMQHTKTDPDKHPTENKKL